MGMDTTQRFAQELVLRHGLFQVLSGICLALVAGAMIRWVLQGMQMNCSFSLCFTVAVYALAPVFLGRALGSLPQLPIWVAWLLGAVLCIYVLYHGVGLILQPVQSSGFSLYLISSFMLVFLSGIAQLLGVAVLHGRLRW